MKQFFLLMVIFSLVAITNTQAQCIKSAESKAAALDANIIKKVDTKTGEVSYLRKTKCDYTGKVSYANVEYCSRTGKFVNVAPSQKASCIKSLANCTKSAGASYTSVGLDYSNCTTAMKAACFQANEKAKLAQATFVRNDRAVKP